MVEGSTKTDHPLIIQKVYKARCLTLTGAINPMVYALFKINHESYILNICSSPKAYLNTRGEVHIFHMSLKFNILVTVISSLLAPPVLMN